MLLYLLQRLPAIVTISQILCRCHGIDMFRLNILPLAITPKLQLTKLSFTCSHF